MRELIEAMVYAPIGFVLGPSRSAGDLVAQGRTQVGNARLMGEMATRMGSAKLAEQATGVVGHIQDVLVNAGLVPRTVPDAPAASASPTVESTTNTASASVAKRAAVVVEDAPKATELAIVDYDSLAASQVVPRLVALSPDELDAVRRYELAHRGRKTILGRVAQLQN